MSHLGEPALSETASVKSKLREFIETIVGALILAVLIMTFVGRSYAVDGPSMLPSLHSGERLLVEKVTYRFRPPQRGDIVVLQNPSARIPLIKRIIGLPGDEIQISGGRLFLNGKPVDEPYINGAMHLRQQTGPVKVPEGHYFVLGDNRNLSLDSRDPQIGFIPRKSIIGRAVLRYWPLTRFGPIQQPETLREISAAPSLLQIGVG